MLKTVYKFGMVLFTAGGAGYALGIGATSAAMASLLFCAIFSFVLFGPDFVFFKNPQK